MIKSSKSIILGIGILFLSLSTAFGEMNAGKEVTIKGKVIDPLCLITMDMKGEGHKECATKCAKSGENLAIMDEKGKIYPIMAGKVYTNPNDAVLNYVEKTVTVKGTLIESGGVSYIMIKEVKGS